ncbi:UNVERIFIED_ORG: putative ATP-dependent endonuclease of OLD family [Rahnella aquatilis]
MRINSVEIEGFWGVKHISLDLNSDYNFIIGPNGIGKTTVLNLITSILMTDIDSIAKVQFDRVHINVIGFDNELYTIDVSKGVGDDDECIINLQIINVDQEQKIFSRMFRTIIQDRSDDHYRQRRLSRRYLQHDDARKIIEDIVNIVWLPIGRFNPVTDKEYRSSAYGNSVDMRLDAVLEGFVKYSSLINKSISLEMAEFQRDALLSSIDSSYSEGLKKSKHKNNASDDMADLMEVFQEVGIPEYKYKRRVSKMFSVLEKVITKIQNGNQKGLTQEEVINAFSLTRTRYLVDRYNEYKNKKDIISNKIKVFIEKLNELFDGRKIFYITDSNEMAFVCGEIDNLSLFDLSSGEKQLVILLGEVLLNENSPCVYIADEPEISLHVSWQEMLVETMSNLNSNMQVIFATHSPDIVSKRTDKIIKM